MGKEWGKKYIGCLNDFPMGTERGKKLDLNLRHAYKSKISGFMTLRKMSNLLIIINYSL